MECAVVELMDFVKSAWKFCLLYIYVRLLYIYVRMYMYVYIYINMHCIHGVCCRRLDDLPPIYICTHVYICIHECMYVLICRVYMECAVGCQSDEY